MNLKEESYDGIAARIIQHEYDHIEGILFTDHLNPLKRRLLKRRLEDISKGKVEVNYKNEISKFKEMKRLVYLLVILLVLGCKNDDKEIINNSTSKSELEELRLMNKQLINTNPKDLKLVYQLGMIIKNTAL